MMQTTNDTDAISNDGFIDQLLNHTDQQITSWFTEQSPESDEIVVALTLDDYDGEIKPVAQLTRTEKSGGEVVIEVDCVEIDSYDRIALIKKTDSGESDTDVFQTVSEAVNRAKSYLDTYRADSRAVTVNTRGGEIDRGKIDFEFSCSGINRENGTERRTTILRKIAGTDIWELVEAWASRNGSGFELFEAGRLTIDALTITNEQKAEIVDRTKTHLIGDEDYINLLNLDIHQLKNVVNCVQYDIEEITQRNVRRAIENDEGVYFDITEEIHVSTVEKVSPGEIVRQAVISNVESDVETEHTPPTEPQNVTQLVWKLCTEALEARYEESAVDKDRYSARILFDGDEWTQRAVALSAQAGLPWKAANVAAIKEQSPHLQNTDVAEKFDIDPSTVTGHCDTIEQKLTEAEWLVDNLTINGC